MGDYSAAEKQSLIVVLDLIASLVRWPGKMAGCEALFRLDFLFTFSSMEKVKPSGLGVSE